MTLAKRSVSQLKTFTGCGYRYYLERVVRVPERPAAWTALGTAFHQAYEDWELNSRTLSLAATLGVFRGRYDSEIERLKTVQPDQSLWMKTPRVGSVDRDIELRRDAGVAMLEKYLDRIQNEDWLPAVLPGGKPALEWEFEMEAGGVLVRGAVDRIEEWGDGSFTVTDLKTGSDREDNRQLGVYLLAVNEQLGVEVGFARYSYSKLDRDSVWVSSDTYTRPVVDEVFKQLETGISNGVFLTNPGKGCQMCNVAPWCYEMNGSLPEKGK